LISKGVIIGWFKRKKKPEKQPLFEPEPEEESEELPEKDLVKDDLSKKVDYRIYSKKKDIYTVAGVDEAIYSRKRIKKEFLIRPTSYRCPKCNSYLQNVKLDGVHFYCLKCEVHHHWSKL